MKPAVFSVHIYKLEIVESVDHLSNFLVSRSSGVHVRAGDIAIEKRITNVDCKLCSEVV